MENGHNTIVRPPEHKYYMSDKRGKDMRRPFYCEFFLDTRDELQHKFKENNIQAALGMAVGRLRRLPDGEALAGAHGARGVRFVRHHVQGDPDELHGEPVDSVDPRVG